MGSKELSKPPKWESPLNLEEAKKRILSLGISLHENVYLTGRYLLWVKNKVGHGKFETWRENNIKLFKKTTAVQMMRYAERCDEKKMLVDYYSDKSSDSEHLDPPVLPPGKYRILYADPPWKYGDELIETYGAATHHYPVMSIEELCDLKDKKDKSVNDLVANNSVLFLWVTSPMLEEGPKIARAWGFEYKAMFVWDKVKHNYGHYNSVRHEILLICTAGSCLPDSKELRDSVITLERTQKHSEKPDLFRDLIDFMYPPKRRVDRIELFARGALPKSWHSWGLEAK